MSSYRIHLTRRIMDAIIRTTGEARVLAAQEAIESIMGETLTQKNRQVAQEIVEIIDRLRDFGAAEKLAAIKGILYREYMSETDIAFC